MTIGEKILKLRKARGWNQEDLAEQVGVSRQAVSRWESDSAKPDADKIVAICDLFGVSADYLLRENYQGELGSVSPQHQTQTTALGKAIRSLTLKQWAGLGMLLGGALVLITLWFLWFFKDASYFYYDTILGVEYYGFRAFIHGESVYGVWWTAILAMVLGLFYLTAKMGPLGMLWKKMGEFFNWD